MNIRLFGIPVVLDEIPSENTIKFLLNQSTKNYKTYDEDDPIIEDDDIKQFLNIVASIQTTFDDDADGLIKSYFIVTRSMRPSNYYP